MSSPSPLPEVPARRLVVAITARALFDLEDSHAVFQAGGVEAYAGYQRERPLAREEWAGLWWSMRLACLRFATTRITDVYLKGTYPPGYKNYQRFLQRLDMVEALAPKELETRLS